MKIQFRGLKIFNIIITTKKSMENLKTELDVDDCIMITNKIKEKLKE